jgi:hypothetical protein
MDLDLEALQDLPVEEAQAGGCGKSCALTCGGSCPATCQSTGV